MNFPIEKRLLAAAMRWWRSGQRNCDALNTKPQNEKLIAKWDAISERHFNLLCDACAAAAAAKKRRVRK